VFENQPRHYIRSLPANPHDQIYCERLGALAVDNALGGYTDFMISKWLTEFVLVPLALVGSGQKSIPVNGMFWKQVVSSTDQPLSPAERPSLQKLEQQPSADVGIDIKNLP
jgi:6-phosphofructokinase 1